MIPRSVRAPTIPIPFQKLLKIVAIVDPRDAQARELIEHITAENYTVEVTDRFERDVFAALAFALMLTAAAEASFTLYRDVTGLANLAGHLLKLAAFVLIYLALVMTGIIRPFDLLFRSLKESEESLQRENAVLASYQRELEAKNRELAALNARKNELNPVASANV